MNQHPPIHGSGGNARNGNAMWGFAVALSMASEIDQAFLVRCPVRNQ